MPFGFAFPIEHVNRFPPGLLLAGVDFPQIEHLTLLHGSLGGTLGFVNAPIAMNLAVFFKGVAFEKHGFIVTRSQAVEKK